MKMPSSVGIFIFIRRETFIFSLVEQENVSNFGARSLHLDSDKISRTLHRNTSCRNKLLKVEFSKQNIALRVGTLAPSEEQILVL